MQFQPDYLYLSKIGIYSIIISFLESFFLLLLTVLFPRCKEISRLLKIILIISIFYLQEHIFLIILLQNIISSAIFYKKYLYQFKEELIVIYKIYGLNRLYNIIFSLSRKKLLVTANTINNILTDLFIAFPYNWDHFEIFKYTICIAKLIHIFFLEGLKDIKSNIKVNLRKIGKERNTKEKSKTFCESNAYAFCESNVKTFCESNVKTFCESNANEYILYCHFTINNNISKLEGNIYLKDNSILIIYGKNGSGKTSLLESIMGVERAIWVNIKDIKLYRNFTYIEQGSEFQIERMILRNKIKNNKNQFKKNILMYDEPIIKISQIQPPAIITLSSLCNLNEAINDLKLLKHENKDIRIIYLNINQNKNIINNFINNSYNSNIKIFCESNIHLQKRAFNINFCRNILGIKKSYGETKSFFIKELIKTNNKKIIIESGLNNTNYLDKDKIKDIKFSVNKNNTTTFTTTDNSESLLF